MLVNRDARKWRIYIFVSIVDMDDTFRGKWTGESSGSEKRDGGECKQAHVACEDRDPNELS